MIRISGFPLFLALAASVALSLAAPAWAALGGAPEPAASGDPNSPAIKRAATNHAGYTVQESSSEVLSIREYVAPNGIVFGVAWNGMARPDLEKLLGGYYASYNAADNQTQRVKSRRSRRVETDQIVVETSGFMRNRRGRAYAPELIPSGVPTDEIQ